MDSGDSAQRDRLLPSCPILSHPISPHPILATRYPAGDFTRVPSPWASPEEAQQRLTASRAS